MAVEIQEPNDLPGGSITPATENNFEVLVYERSADAAGIKRLGIGPWKEYMNYNGNKVNNVANYVGMPSGYPWETDENIPYGPPYADENMTITDQLGTLQTKLGISTQPGTFDPLYPRFQSVENSVNGTGSPATGGLLQRMTKAETDIESLAEEIGGSGGSGSTLTGRIETLENKVGNEASGADPSTGLIHDVRTLQDEVEDGTNGLITKVSTNTADITTIKGTLGSDVCSDPAGVVHQSNTTYNDIHDSSTGILKQIEDIKSKVYTFSGSIVSVNDPDTTTELTLSNGDTRAISSLVNGEVFDINPPGGELTINGVTYSKGQNIAWVKPEGGIGSFDELGVNIDVAELNEIKAKVDAMSMVITIDGSWTSADIPDGIYQCSSICRASGIDYMSIFIISFSGGYVYTSTQKIDISNNFNTYWEIDSDLLKPKSLSGTRKLSIHKIGEI